MSITDEFPSTEITWWRFWAEKPTVPTLTLAIARAHLTRLPSVISFALDFITGDEKDKLKALPLFMSMAGAFHYLERFKPGMRIVGCPLDSDDVPEELAGRITRAQYVNALRPLRKLLSGPEYEEKRKRLITLFATMAVSLVFPLVLLEEVGVMFALAVFYHGKQMFSRLDGANRLQGDSVRRNLEECTNEINKTIASRGISLIDPNETDIRSFDTYPKGTLYIEWVVMPQ